MTAINLLDRTLGPFTIISELGRGGMAVVYKAYQLDLQRTVALKILPPELSLDKSYLQRFLQEARSAAALEHPHIVPIHMIGQTEGFNYIAMKYIAGKTLKEIVQERGALDVQEAATMLEQVSAALDYAHSQGIIHRDIKPSNLMADQSGWIYLTDFGLARGGATGGLTMAGTVMGTPEYMSPEQAQGLPTIGPPTDIYALGVVLYELLTGKMPFQADTPMGMLVARLQYAPRPPRDYRGDLPMAVEDVIMRALARKPEARYATAGAMIAALKQAAGPGPHAVAPQPPLSPPMGLIAAPGAGADDTPAPGATQVVPPQRTPPYVIPATAAAARFDARPSAPAAKRPRARRGRFIALAAIVAALAAILGGMVMITRDDPRIAQGLRDGAAALAQQGGTDRAIAAYKHVLALDPKNAEAHEWLALIYALRHRNQDALAAARAAIDANPQSAFAQAILADTLGGEGEYTDARAAADKAIALNDRLSSGYSARASVKASQAVENTDPDMLTDAAADADKAIALAQQESNLHQALAHSARGYVFWQEYLLTDDTAKVDRGVEAFNQAIGLQGQIALFHSNLGYFYDAQEQHHLAQQQFEAALDTDDQYAHAHAGLGWNLYYLKDYEGALREFNQAIAIDPRDTDAYLGISSVYQAQAAPDYDRAIEALDKAAAAAPKHPNTFARLGWAYRSKANQLAADSDDRKHALADAEAQFRKAIDLNERYLYALNGLGYVLQEQADASKDAAKYQEAIDVLGTSLAIKEDQPYIHTALGWDHYGLQQYADAAAAFNRAIALKGDYGDAFYGLGRVYQDQGKTDQARQAYQTAVQKGSQYARAALDLLK